MSFQFPVSIDQEILAQYREELQWTNQEVEMLAIKLERNPEDMEAVEQVRDLIQEAWMSSVKLDLTPLSESLDDTLKGLDFLLDWQVYPPAMTEFVLLLIDRVMIIAQEVEESQFIDMRKTQAILVALQYIILAKSVDAITEGIEAAIVAISQDIDEPSAVTAGHDGVDLFGDGVDLFGDGVDLFDDAPASPVIEPIIDIFVPQAILNPLYQARDFMQGHSDENCLTLLGQVSKQAAEHYNDHTSCLQELALACNIMAGEPLDYECLYQGICLHDIALASQTDLFQKEDPLTQDEIAELKLHPVQSAEFLHQLNLSHEAELLVLHHHEHLDGSGYPFGLKGDNISEQGKLVAIVDSFHNAIEQHASMGTRESVLTAILEINIHIGKHYDKLWVKLFNSVLHDYWLPDWRESQRGKVNRVG